MKDYSSSSVFGKQRLVLTEDKVAVSGLTMTHVRYDQTFELRMLSPLVDRYMVRSPLFFPLCLMFAIGLAGYFAGSEFIPARFEHFGPRFFAIFSAIGFVGALFTFPAIPVHQFRLITGVPVIAVYQAGKDAKHCREFVDGLVLAITHAKEPNQALLPTPTAVTDPAAQAPRQP